MNQTTKLWHQTIGIVVIAILLTLTVGKGVFGQTYEQSTYGSSSSEDEETEEAEPAQPSERNVRSTTNRTRNGGNMRPSVLSADSNSNLRYGSTFSIYRLHSYIGHQIKFMKPCNQHRFTTDEQKVYMLPHVRFEDDQLGQQLANSLRQGFLSQAKYDQERNNYEDNFLITSSIAFPKISKTSPLTINSTIRESDYIYTNEADILRENWTIVSIRNLPELEGLVHKSQWDEGEYMTDTQDLMFVLRGTKTGREILWTPDEYYRCERPDDFDGVYFMPYVHKTTSRLAPGRKYVVLHDLQADLQGGEFNFLQRGDQLTYVGTRHNTKRFADGKYHSRYVTVFTHKQDSVYLPVSVKVNTKKEASKSMSDANRELLDFDLEPADMFSQRSKIAAKNAPRVGDVINAEQAELNHEEPRMGDLLQKFGEKFGSLIIDGRISNGMTEEMVHEAWGPADLRSVSKGNGSIIVMESFPNLSWVRFRNGRVFAFGGGY